MNARRIVLRLLAGKRGRLSAALSLAGLALGGFLVLAALHLSQEAGRLSGSSLDDGRFRDIVVISRDIGGTGMNSGGNGMNSGAANSTAFTDAEIAELGGQDFVRRIGRVTGNRFGLSAEVRIGPAAMSTMLFCEAVDDSFLDAPDAWGWTPDSDRVPLLLSRDILALYNFVFASSQGLPLLTERTMSLVPFVLELRGPGGHRTYRAFIAGTTERIASVLVPQSFIDYANAEIAEVPDPPPNRLILELEDARGPEPFAYFAERGFSVSSGSLGASQAARLVQLLLGFIALIGGFLVVLACVLFSANVRLHLSLVRDDLRRLSLLGYTPGDVLRPLATAWLPASISAAVLVVVSLRLVLFFAASYFATRGLELASGFFPSDWIAAIVFLALAVSFPFALFGIVLKKWMK